MDELLTDICCGTGGDCDNHLVWTSTASTDEIVEDDENEDCTRC